MIKIIALTILLALSHPSYSVEANPTNEKNAYCNRWADRFLTLKDGKNYSAEKFLIYVDICKDYYLELRNYYKSLGDSYE